MTRCSVDSSRKLLGALRGACVAVGIACAALCGGTVSAQTAHDEYDRLAHIIQQLDDAEGSPFRIPTRLADKTVFSDAEFLERGVIDESMRQWLEAARAYIPDLIRTTDLPYRRSDYTQPGTPERPNVFGRHRKISRAIEFLIIDARRRDPSVVAPLLKADIKLCARTAEARSTQSALIAAIHSGRVQESIGRLVDEGAVGQELAAELLLETQAISSAEALGVRSTLASDSAELAQMYASLRALDGSARIEFMSDLPRFAGFEGDDLDDMSAGPLSDAGLAEALEQFARYRGEIKAMLRLTDPAEIEATAKRLSDEVKAGSFGSNLKLFQPMQELVIRQLRRNEAAWALVRADLALLAEGKVTPAQLNDAGPFLYRASAMAETISSVEQSEIESFRLAHGHLDNDAKARALELLARFDRGIVQEAYEGSLRGRARFGNSIAVRVGRRGDDMFVGTLQPGINGAVRIMLAAAIASATKVDGGAVADAKDPAPTPQDLAVASVRIAALLADTAQHGHSLASIEILSDAVTALRELESLGKLDDAGRAQLATALKRFAEDDPFGFARATKEMRRAFTDPRSLRFRCVFTDRALVAALSPQEIVALMSAAATPSDFLVSQCDCPATGPLLDMRGWFKPDALAAADKARRQLKSRELDAERDSGRDRAIPGPPLAGLSVPAPFDLAEKTAAGEALLKRLHEVAKRTDAGGLQPAEPRASDSKSDIIPSAA
jgi:hypothetical protein